MVNDLSCLSSYPISLINLSRLGCASKRYPIGTFHQDLTLFAIPRKNLLRRNSSITSTVKSPFRRGTSGRVSLRVSWDDPRQSKGIKTYSLDPHMVSWVMNIWTFSLHPSIRPIHPRRWPVVNRRKLDWLGPLGIPVSWANTLESVCLVNGKWVSQD